MHECVCVCVCVWVGVGVSIEVLVSSIDYSFALLALLVIEQFGACVCFVSFRLLFIRYYDY